jgi:hypothetical protein
MNRISPSHSQEPSERFYSRDLHGRRTALLRGGQQNPRAVAVEGVYLRAPGLRADGGEDEEGELGVEGRVPDLVEAVARVVGEDGLREVGGDGVPNCETLGRSVREVGEDVRVAVDVEGHRRADGVVGYDWMGRIGAVSGEWVDRPAQSYMHTGGQRWSRHNRVGWLTERSRQEVDVDNFDQEVRLQETLSVRRWMRPLNTNSQRHYSSCLGRARP